MAIRVASDQAAWEAAAEVFPGDWAKDVESSERAGYGIYRSTEEGGRLNYICELGDGLEINLEGGKCIRITTDRDEDRMHISGECRYDMRALFHWAAAQAGEEYGPASSREKAAYACGVLDAMKASGLFNDEEIRAGRRRMELTY